MRRARLLGLAVLLAPLAFFAGDTSAIQPGPVQLPAVQLIAEDACSGGTIAGLSASLVPLAGTVSPGPIQMGPHDEWKTLAPGSYGLVLSALGYNGIGSAASGSPITVTVSPGPTQLVGDSGFSETQVVSAALLPATNSSTPCLDLSAQTLPPVALTVVDGVSHQLEQAGIFYFFKHDTTGNQLVPSQNPGGSYAFAPGSIDPGLYDVQLSTPGYYPLGTAPDGSLTPVEVTVNPGPQQLPGGNSYDQGVKANIALAPDQPVPTIIEAHPKSGPLSGGTTVTIVGTGFSGTYSVTFGPAAATSFTVNKAGTKITAVSPSSTMTGPVQITVTTLGGTATTIFGYS